MSAGVQTVIYPVRDLAAAKSLFGTLAGAPPYMDEPYYVGFTVDGQDVGLDPHGHSKGMTGPLAHWHVDDIRRAVAALLDAGARPDQDVRDVGGGKLTATVTDPDGNRIGLIQPA